MSAVVTIPNPEKLTHVDQLCSDRKPYPVGEKVDELFVEAMREICQWHRECSPVYQRIWDQSGADLDAIKTVKDLESIPPIMAGFFKKHEILSIPREDVFLHLTSSGTTGQKSQIFFDEWSIKVAQRMVDDIFHYYNWVTEDKANYLLYTYEPTEGSKLGTAYTDHFLCKYAPVNEVHYGLRYQGEKGHKFDLFGSIDILKEYATKGLPVRIFGFPSFFYFTLKTMKELGIGPLKLHPQSLVFLGGGWKGHQNKAVSKQELYSLANELLGIPDERLRDGFGSVEHCIPYIECQAHHFHVPQWSRVLIRDVKTLEVLPSGESGFINFVSPYITSVPAHSVLMNDLGILHQGSECSCELETPWFEVLGRAGVSKSKSCAISAAELLKDFT